MITQSFLDRFEGGLLRSYHRLSRQGLVRREGIPLYLKETTERNDFVSAFMKAFKEYDAILEVEIERGCHFPARRLVEAVNQLVETKLFSTLLQKPNLDESSFRLVVQELKKEVRLVFYKNYLG